MSLEGIALAAIAMQLLAQFAPRLGVDEFLGESFGVDGSLCRGEEAGLGVGLRPAFEASVVPIRPLAHWNRPSRS